MQDHNNLELMTENLASRFMNDIARGWWDHELLEVLEDVRRNYLENMWQRQVISFIWRRAEELTSPKS